MDTADKTQFANVAQFPMKKPEMQIGKPEQVTLPDLPVESEYAHSTQTWD